MKNVAIKNKYYVTAFLSKHVGGGDWRKRYMLRKVFEGFALMCWSRLSLKDEIMSDILFLFKSTYFRILPIFTYYI